MEIYIPLCLFYSFNFRLNNETYLYVYVSTNFPTIFFSLNFHATSKLFSLNENPTSKPI